MGLSEEGGTEGGGYSRRGYSRRGLLPSWGEPPVGTRCRCRLINPAWPAMPKRFQDFPGEI